MSLAWWWLAIAGLGFLLACAAAQALIAPRIRSATGRAVAHRLSASGFVIGLGMIPAGLALEAHHRLGDFWWYQITVWGALIFFSIVVLLVLLAMIVKLFKARSLIGDGLEAHVGTVYVTTTRIYLAQDSHGAARNHVICIDGTWNDPDSRTNVYRLRTLLGPNSDRQIARYHSGLGVRTNIGPAFSFLGEKVSKRWIACGTGMGASPIRWKAYLDFVADYRPGDRIFIFGFSRGAAIARMLANDILECGIPELMQAEYQKSSLTEDYLIDFAVPRGMKSRPVEIEMLGLWDTVTAFGLPWLKIDPFYKLTIGPRDKVRKAFHLVAIDERRQSFAPTLMNQDGENVEEIWFSGAHGNVGGGLGGRNALSDIALTFMINRAKECGLEFSKDAEIQFSQDEVDFIGEAVPAKRDAAGEIWKPGRLWSKTRRKIQVRGGAPGARPQIHKSVVERIANRKCAYHPPNISELGGAYAIEDRD